MLEQISQLIPIRKNRLEKAEESVKVAEQRLREAQTKLSSAKETLNEYVHRLPALIDQLYETILYREVSQAEVSNTTAKEGLLRARVEDLKAEVKTAQDAVSNCELELSEAKSYYQTEQKKLEVFLELEKELIEAKTGEAQRMEDKLIDELSSAAFVRRNA